MRVVDSVASTASPSAPPTCAVVLTSPEVRPASLGVAPDIASVMSAGKHTPMPKPSRIITGSTSQIDVAVSRSRDFGFMHSKAPITARKDGDTVHIETNEDGWTTGDMRMVTVVVPPETQVTVANAGDIKATGLRAESSFSSTGRGTVTIDDYNAPALHVTSSNGLVSLHQIVATRLDITSSNDRVEGTGLQVRDGTIESDDRVSLAFATGSDTLVNADANDGKVRLSGFAAGASVETSRKSGEEDDDSSSQIVRVGTGAGHLDVHANDGNITLIQEP